VTAGGGHGEIGNEVIEVRSSDPSPPPPASDDSAVELVPSTKAAGKQTAASKRK